MLYNCCKKCFCPFSRIKQAFSTGNAYSCKETRSPNLKVLPILGARAVTYCSCTFVMPFFKEENYSNQIKLVNLLKQQKERTFRKIGEYPLTGRKCHTKAFQVLSNYYLHRPFCENTLLACSLSALPNLPKRWSKGSYAISMGDGTLK